MILGLGMFPIYGNVPNFDKNTFLYKKDGYEATPGNNY